MARRKFGDLIILLPGITGSVLQCHGKDAWAITPQSAISALFSLGGSIKDLEIKGKDDPSKDDLGDGVTAPRLVQDIHLIPGFWQIDGYTAIKTRLFAELTLEEGKNWFDYPYDWRRDNRVHGRQLGERAPRWLDAWRKASGNKDAKLVLLAHSMGGLVARDFLERHEGWKITRHLITFGTPYRGSMNAVSTLVNGMEKSLGPLSLDLSSLIRSFPSMHQLLPIYPSVDVAGTLVRPGETTLPGIDKAKAADALRFHRDIEAAVTANQANAAYRDAGYQITPIVGIFQPTDQSAKLSGGKVLTYTSLSGEDLGGDGTVPRVSATPIELSDTPRETYVSTKHGSLQNAEACLSHVVGTVTRKSLKTYKDTPFNGFSLATEPVLGTRQELDIVATTAGATTAARVMLEDVATGRAIRRRTLRRRKDGSFRTTVPPLPEGVYRLTVAGADAADSMTPVSDLITVIDRRKRNRG
jgi:pimeloyl-ACP methyl ester carboxylesterase